MSSLRCRLALALVIIPCFVRGTAASAADEIAPQVPEIAPSNLSPAATSDNSEKDSLSALLNQGAAPVWIWGDEANTRYSLQKSFSTQAVSARLKATCDNHMVVTLNGKRVAASDTWEEPVEVDVTAHLVKGENVLQADVRNAGGASGFILKLVLKTAGGETEYVVSDDSWTAQSRGQAAKKVKTFGKAGVGPWNDVMTRAGGSTGNSGAFELLPGFQVEKLFTVPKEELGSWVCLTTDHKGRLIASDQGDKGLYRITPGKPGTQEPARVEKLKVNMTACQGMLYAFDALYCSVNGGPGSGLYRLKDTNGDDQFDDVKKLRDFRGGGEHGPHALRLSPDGRSIYVIAGNHTQPPFNAREDLQNAQYSSRIPTNWDEDLLLPRQWDANGHARGVMAPGGWIAHTDPEGQTWEIVSIGYRNPYDMDFNADGELFAYDADMEWDMGSPWYRPTRVVHAVSGSEFGWRSGTGKWPVYYPDSLPPVVNTGPGSPVGASFGYGAKFPAKYQNAFYICDWTFGTMYAIHLTPSGSTYTGEKEEFLSRSPLPLTDVAIGADGAMYFTVGGRGTQSELYRVTYIGDESTAPAVHKGAEFAELRALRRELEQFHDPNFRRDDASAIELLARHRNHPDRFIRYAATIGLATRETGLDVAGLLAAGDADSLITTTVALARHSSLKVPRGAVLAALAGVDFAGLDESQQLAYLRAVGLAFIRLEGDDATDKERFVSKLDGFFPSKSDDVNRELAQVLVFLESPTIVAKTVPFLMLPPQRREEDLQNLLARNKGYGGAIAQMLANQPDLQQYHYAFVLRNAKAGWTLDLRKDYFQWFEKASRWSGGASYQKFLINTSNDAFENSTEQERLAVEAIGARKPFVVPELPKPQGPGRDWTLADILSLESKLKGRDFKNGQKMFSATRCVVCHRFAGDGGATGPDLTQLAGRFNLKDLTESIVEPSKVISDQYRATTILTDSGKVHTGRVVSETDEALIVVVDPENSTKVVELKRSEIEELKPSPTSLMPGDLLKTLNENEVLDLLAYLLSRGDPNHAMFRR